MAAVSSSTVATPPAAGAPGSSSGRPTADVLVEASWTNLDSGLPAIDFCRSALDNGMHLVLANKGPVALAYDEMQRLARSNDSLLYLEATVMAGTPVLAFLRETLRGCRVARVRGIFNGATNYMLTQMAHDVAYDDALAQAQALGYAEADPSARCGRAGCGRQSRHPVTCAVRQ